MTGLVDVPHEDAGLARQASVMVWLCAAMSALFLAWAMLFTVAEVSTGQGSVVPGSREQVIQSLEGGILAELTVTEGSIVEPGAVIARLDPTRSSSNVEETQARYLAAMASLARVHAELAEADTISFPAELAAHEDLRLNETKLFRSRTESYRDNLSALQVELDLILEELGITERLTATGAASRVELIRLQRDRATAEAEILRLRSDRSIALGEEQQRLSAEVEAQRSVLRGLTDTLTRMTLYAPMRGVVKEISVTTIGGVVPPGGDVMTIVPLDDELLIETRISPRDIAFIHPGQRAMVKVTAYDYAIYGGLEGEVVTISPNTVRDEVQPELIYYRVYIRTARNSLVNARGDVFPIVPGMITSVDIRTGEKTIWQYLVKPFNRAQEALRER